MLKKYLKSIGKTEYINMNNKIQFIHRATTLKFGDNRKIEEILVSSVGENILVIE